MSAEKKSFHSMNNRSSHVGYLADNSSSGTGFSSPDYHPSRSGYSMTDQHLLGSERFSFDPPETISEDSNFETTCLTEAKVVNEVMQLTSNPKIRKLVKAALKMDCLANTEKKSYTDLQSLPTSQYLENAIIPILVSGLKSVVAERPRNAIKSLATYLLIHRSEYEEDDTLDLKHHPLLKTKVSARHERESVYRV